MSTNPPGSVEDDTQQSTAEHVEDTAKAAATCGVCSCIFSGDDVEDKISHPCDRCNSPWCKSCLRKVLLDASRYLYKMPPRCCRIFNPDIARPILSATEMSQFEARFEEWRTPNRVYCPNRTCSAFIADIHLQTSPAVPGSSQQNADEPPIRRCPECTTLVCSACRQEAHTGRRCPGPIEIDGALLHQRLDRWGYRSCPRCGYRIKKMFGCLHMQCVCGQHFCWECQGRIPTDCDAGCYEDEREDDDVTISDAGSVEDLDRRSSVQWLESGIDFGPEPEQGDFDPDDICCC